MKKILFVVCTHGDELAGLDLFLKYPYGKTQDVEWKVIVGNPDAMMLNLRFLETDLNRSCHVKNAKSREEIRAQTLKKIVADYDVVYDIHTTTAIRNEKTWGRIVFVNNINTETLEEVKYIGTKFIIWDSDTEYQKRYVTALHPIGITLEYEKLPSVLDTQKMIFADFNSITHQKRKSKQPQLLIADRPILQKTRKKHNLNLKEMRRIPSKLMKLIGLPHSSTYFPIFTNPESIDPVNYCFLNKKIDFPKPTPASFHDGQNPDTYSQ